ncbi:globin domain-containing protein, partial [Acaryochloris sp. IP29b_bin.148]|uniref:globin family protein n=1 Tax=Acaryochloris sp. IP29b_bin.148 TaxID=2969218 RepID=UPI00261E2549
MALQVELLESSFEQIKPQSSEFVTSFYNHLFTDYPEAKPLFEGTDMKKQGVKLLQSLVLVIENLRQPDTLSNALKGLGARHVQYGALPEHYPLVGATLLKTFEEYLGNAWTQEVQTAWVDAYGAITTIMLDGAEYSEADVQLKPDAAAPPADSGLQVELLETSFAQVKPVANEFSDRFY